MYLRWSVIQTVLEVFTELSAPYLLSEGSLLHLYRNCSVGLSDIDFSLGHQWWKTNKDYLNKKLLAARFNQTAVFGSIESFGYEEAWEKDGIKVDIFSSVRKDNVHVIGFWVKGRLYPCSMPVQRVVVYRWRGARGVRIPYPVKDAVLAMYGRNYKYPMDGWQWDIYPFLTGYCSYQYLM